LPEALHKLKLHKKSRKICVDFVVVGEEEFFSNLASKPKVRRNRGVLLG
jgi:hypothetical protein